MPSTERMREWQADSLDLSVPPKMPQKLLEVGPKSISEMIKKGPINYNVIKQEIRNDLKIHFDRIINEIKKKYGRPGRLVYSHTQFITALWEFEEIFDYDNIDDAYMLVYFKYNDEDIVLRVSLLDNKYIDSGIFIENIPLSDRTKLIACRGIIHDYPHRQAVNLKPPLAFMLKNRFQKEQVSYWLDWSPQSEENDSLKWHCHAKKSKDNIVFEFDENECLVDVVLNDVSLNGFIDDE